MPPTVLKLLVPTRALSDNDWYVLVEARRAAISPHLDSFTLGTLGDVKCLRRAGFEDPIRDCSTLYGVPGYSCASQGVFGYNWESMQYYGERKHRDGHFFIWGLTRKGSWLLAKVSFRGDSGWKDRGAQYAIQIGFEEVELPYMCVTAQVTPRKVYVELGKAVAHWVNNRKVLYDTALKLYTRLGADDRVIMAAGERRGELIT